ncbi:MAG: transcription-repair coupling factor [Bacillota bacterium]|nr:transcription-repair coupling factor [Bacillota bacterium]
MQTFLAQKLNESDIFDNIRQSIAGKQTPVAVTGVGAVQKAFICHALQQNLKSKLLYVAADETEATIAAQNLKAFLGEGVYYFPTREIGFLNVETRSREWEYSRLFVLSQISSRNYNAVVTTADALLQYTIDIDRLKNGSFKIKIGDTMPLEGILKNLNASGYVRADTVEGKGQYSVRGGIVDIFPVSEETPVRIELWGDEIDSMGTFDVLNQRRIENTQSVEITPAAEIILDAEAQTRLSKQLSALIKKYEKKSGMEKALETLSFDLESLHNGSLAGTDKYVPLLSDKPATLLDHMGKDTLIALSEEPKISEHLKNYLYLQNEDIKSYLSKGLIVGETAKLTLLKEELYSIISKYRVLYLDTLPHTHYELPIKALNTFISKQLPNLSGNIDFIADDITSYQKQGYDVCVMTGAPQRGEILRDLLCERGIAARFSNEIKSLTKNCVEVTVGAVNGGMEFTDIKLAILCDGDKPEKKKKHTSTRRNAEKIKSYSDLKPGDYVVHVNHGIGQYLGIEKLTVEGIVKDYVKIRYAGTDVLYVPANQLDLISKYLSAENADKGVKLSKMGGGEWQRTKSKVKSAVSDLADSLIALYAERQKIKGYAFGPDQQWQHDFEDKFEFDETDDQLRCIVEIKADMEKPQPMDRLLCGDVGFGKTEVALRAAFKCISEGKQVALLVPTTILAWQHFQTIIKRFQGYPVHVDILSRFRTKKQQEEIVKKLRRGEVDIVVGTHRLIQKDIVFKDLGLIIIDEEQRFGVAHKERLKELTKTVDALTLTATPIPRTLNMALSGIRDMSLIEEPPRDRHPVSTYVIEYDFSVIMEAVRHEMRRGGQVFYLHNRIDTIEQTAGRIAQELPDKRVAFAHGQMTEEQLSDIWTDVVNGDIDVLVCTTIIETGIDVPNANTLIIEDADRLGLAQLYQLRGRVGRSYRRASCYLTYRRGKVLSEEASKRLSAIREFTEFGSGYKIAMRDLEIRGAGNILGSQQHGHMMTVGYDLYIRLLDEAVRIKRGEIAHEKTECVFDIAVSAHIPSDYIESSAVRVDIYKKIAAIENKDDLLDLQDELADRFGDIPVPVQNLCEIALLRNMATSLEISEIVEKSGRIIISAENMKFEDIADLSAPFKGRLLYNAGEKPFVSLMPKKGETGVAEIKKFLDLYAELKKRNAQ